jgi:hypothetical protein
MTTFNAVVPSLPSHDLFRGAVSTEDVLAKDNAPEVLTDLSFTGYLVECIHGHILEDMCQQGGDAQQKGHLYLRFLTSSPILIVLVAAPRSYRGANDSLACSL